jgi:hypothetical protein
MGASPGRAAVRSTEPEPSLLDFMNVGRCLTRAEATSHYTERLVTRMLLRLAESAPAQRTDLESHHHRSARSLRDRMPG